jgi:hypothetical protein
MREPFYSLITLFGKIANSIAVPLSLLLLEFTAMSQRGEPASQRF